MLGRRFWSAVPKSSSCTRKFSLEILIVFAFFVFFVDFKENEQTDDPMPFAVKVDQIEEDLNLVDSRNEIIEKACKNPQIDIGNFEGIHSLLDLLENNKGDFCNSWISIGREIVDTFSGGQEQPGKSYVCADKKVKRKNFCHDKPYKVEGRRSMAYVFSDDDDNVLEKKLTLFNCEVHSFPFDNDMDYDDVHHMDLWWEHNWMLASEFGEIQVPLLPPEKDGLFNSNTEKRSVRKMPLKMIIDSLGHRGRSLDYLFSSVEKIGWRVLDQVLRSNHLLTIKQIAVSIFLPLDDSTSDERLLKYKQMYEILRGLSCLGFKLIRVKPLDYIGAAVLVKEVNRNSSVGFEVNLAKV